MKNRSYLITVMAICFVMATSLSISAQENAEYKKIPDGIVMTPFILLHPNATAITPAMLEELRRPTEIDPPKLFETQPYPDAGVVGIKAGQRELLIPYYPIAIPGLFGATTTLIRKWSNDRLIVDGDFTPQATTELTKRLQIKFPAEEVNRQAKAFVIGFSMAGRTRPDEEGITGYVRLEASTDNPAYNHTPDIRIIKVGHELGFPFEGHVVTAAPQEGGFHIPVAVTEQVYEMDQKESSIIKVSLFHYYPPEPEVPHYSGWRAPSLNYAGTVSKDTPREIREKTPFGEVSTFINDAVIYVAAGTVDCEGMEADMASQAVMTQ